MEVLAVFRTGRWIPFTPRKILTNDPRITQPLFQKAASAYVTALQKGYSEERAHILAETIVYKEIYQELDVDKVLQKEVEMLMDHGEKA